MSRLVSWIQRRTAFILIACLVLTIAGGYYSFRLFQNLQTDLEQLLPAQSRSVRDLDQVAKRLKSIDNIAVLVFSKDVRASKRFVIDLAGRLEAFPKNQVSDVEYRIDRELEFFRKRSALYMDLKDLTRVRDYVRDKIRWEHEIRNPLNIFSGAEIPEPELDFRMLRRKYESKESTYTRFPGGFFATPDETKRVILVDVPGKTLGISEVKELQQRIIDTVESMKPTSYSPDLEIHYTGSVREMLEEQDALVEDLVISTIAVLILVSAAMLAFFRSFAATVALVLSVLASTLWTFGLAYFAVGYLNANSAFLGSIVLGNGINFGIILLARYLEERRAGVGAARANAVALRGTATATLTAALAAGLSYGSLMLTTFRGFNQFGVIGLIGMVLSWLGAYTLLPALLAALERRSFIRVRVRPRGEAGGAWWAPTRLAARMIARYPRGLAVSFALLTGLSGWMISRGGPGLLETHLDKLRSRRSVESGAAFYTQYTNEIFQRFLTPIVVLPSSRDHALEISARLKALKKQQGPDSPIVSVQTIDDFIPKDQPAKFRVLAEIRSLLNPRILRQLSSPERQRVDTFLSPEAFRRVDVGDLPHLVREKFREKNGEIGKLVLVEPPLTRDIWEGDHLSRFIEGLRHTTDSVEPGAPVAGGMPISADLMTSISRDGPRATVVSLFGVVALVILIFRELKAVSLSLFALLIGVIWFGGAIVGMADHGFKINFLNFVALPITFGIGVDYGVNIFQRYRQRSSGGIVRVVCETGGAVALCSLTTIIGYSSLLMASNQGFVSFGLLAVLGEITCLTAALVALPAVLVSFERARGRTAGPSCSAGAGAPGFGSLPAGPPP